MVAGRTAGPLSEPSALRGINQRAASGEAVAVFRRCCKRSDRPFPLLLFTGGCGPLFRFVFGRRLFGGSGGWTSVDNLSNEHKPMLQTSSELDL
ncbi:Protein of unknown function [Gryllus bimaculatus]|nr:Protein of unknown function [Gryllus bimaculatus]